MQTARRPFVIKSIIVMPIATQNNIKPSIRFMGIPFGMSDSMYNICRKFGFSRKKYFFFSENRV